MTDRLLLNTHKSTLQLALIRWWYDLEQTEVPDIARVVAGWFLEGIKFLLGTKNNAVKGILWTALVSLSLTSAAILSGRMIVFGWETGISDFFTLFLSNEKIVISAYLPNLIFDLITIAITVAVVRKIHVVGVIRAVGWISIDILVAGVLAIICVTSCVAMIDILYLEQFPEFKTNFWSWWGGVLHIFNPSHPDSSRITVSNALYSFTTFIPTFIFLLLLVSFNFLKLASHAGIKLSKYVLETATEGDSEKLLVFTMFGGMFAVLGLLIKAVIHISS